MEELLSVLVWIVALVIFIVNRVIKSNQQPESVEPIDEPETFEEADTDSEQSHQPRPQSRKRPRPAGRLQQSLTSLFEQLDIPTEIDQPQTAQNIEKQHEKKPQRQMDKLSQPTKTRTRAIERKQKRIPDREAQFAPTGMNFEETTEMLPDKKQNRKPVNKKQHDRSDLRNYIIWKEILDKPLSLREYN